MGQAIEFFGYTNVIVSGGDGTAQSSGGGGGSVVLRQRQPALEPSTEVAAYGPGGAVINYASVFANGGAGAQAGNAGAVQLSTQTNVAFGDSFEVVLNFGDIDATGGVASDTACGTGGELRMSAIAGVQNSGTIDVSAGVSPPGIDAGCSSGDVELVGLAGPVQNTGAISNDGGAGKIGSAGGQVSLLGAGVTNGATISCDGGDGIDFGGSGGGITLFASPTGASTNTGALSAAGGTGTIIGSNGVIEIDGTIVGS